MQITSELALHLQPNFFIITLNHMLPFDTQEVNFQRVYLIEAQDQAQACCKLHRYLLSGLQDVVQRPELAMYQHLASFRDIDGVRINPNTGGWHEIRDQLGGYVYVHYEFKAPTPSDLAQLAKYVQLIRID